MTELDRADEFALSIINNYERQMSAWGFAFPVLDPDLIGESEEFISMVMQHIKIRGYSVCKVHDPDGYALLLNKEKPIPKLSIKDMEESMEFRRRRMESTNKKNVIKPKVENGKVILDRDNPLHRYIFNDGEEN